MRIVNGHEVTLLGGQLTDTTLVMRHGAVVEHGSTATVLDQPQHPYTQLLRASIPGPGWKPERTLSPAPAR